MIHAWRVDKLTFDRMVDACAFAEDEALGALLFEAERNPALARLFTGEDERPRERVFDLGDRKRTVTTGTTAAQVAAMTGVMVTGDFSDLIRQTGLGIDLEETVNGV